MLEIRKRPGQLQSSCSVTNKHCPTRYLPGCDYLLERVPSDSHHFRNINLDLPGKPLSDRRERRRTLSHEADFSLPELKERLRSVDNCRASLCSCSAASRLSSLASASSTSPRSISMCIPVRRVMTLKRFVILTSDFLSPSI